MPHPKETSGDQSAQHFSMVPWQNQCLLTDSYGALRLWSLHKWKGDESLRVLNGITACITFIDTGIQVLKRYEQYLYIWKSFVDLNICEFNVGNVLYLFQDRINIELGTDDLCRDRCKKVLNFLSVQYLTCAPCDTLHKTRTKQNSYHIFSFLWLEISLTTNLTLFILIQN